MIAATLVCLLIFGVVLGLSRPFVSRLGLGPAEELLAGAVLSLLGAWVLAWVVFTSGMPLAAYALVPVLSLANLVLARRSLRPLWSDPEARDLILGQATVTAWCVLCLAFVHSHSGGAWLGDWLEHWQRAHFFLRDWPADKLFFDIYEVPARPPLGNVLTAVFMRLSAVDYAHYQLVMTVLCSLAFLPVGLLALRFGGRRAVRVAAAVLMVNPLFMQNATYPWTKLQAACFILAGFYFFLRVRDQGAGSRTAGILCAVSLGCAVVTHYSAGPYVLALAAAWMALGRRSRWEGNFGRTTLLAALAGACVLAPWFGWSIARYGVHGTFLSNTSVSMMQKAPGNPLVIMALNLRDSLIPPQVRGFAGTLFRQSSPWGALRDQSFLVYQLNPLLALGCVGWVVVLWQAWRVSRAAGRREALFWAIFVVGTILLSTATYGDRDHYGTGHACLQSLVLLGLAFLASRWGRLGRAWKAALILGWAVDFTLGVALQLAVEDFALDRWLTPTRSMAEIAGSYGVVAQANLSEKIIAQLAFFADILVTPPALVVALLGALLCITVMRARRTPEETRP
jgi:4-amino-4-deoxy-L-arabinose transferase-like glycosyltransferase